MENLDGTVIQTAAPAMAHDFGVRAVDLNIAMTAYLLTVAVCVPVSGWLADRFGDRRVFATALLVFTVASAICAFARKFVIIILELLMSMSAVPRSSPQQSVFAT